MDESVLFPSPNWFQVSGFAVSKDGWLVYGGPTKSLCILKPLDPGQDGILQKTPSYQTQIYCKVHKEKIVSVDLSRQWPEKKLILTGSADGIVKQWNVDQLDNNGKIKSTHTHAVHKNEKEEVVGVAYSSEPFAVTVGGFGNVVKWDLNSNIAKNYNNFLKSFRPSCVACSHHIPLNVAVGTKQGVIFVLDLNNQGKIIYKIRGQDDEIVNVSWCPQYKTIVRKSLNESQRRSTATERLEKMRSEVDEPEVNLNNSAIAKTLPEDSFDETIVQEDDMFDIYKDHEADEFGHKKFEPEDIIVKVKEEKENDDFLAECLKLKEVILKNKSEPEPTIANLVEALDKTHVDSDISDSEEQENDTGESPEVDEKETQAKELGDSTIHTHRHLLATIGKYGGVRIWSKTGKLVGSCAVPNSVNKSQRNKRPNPNSNSLLWYKPDVLLIADGKSQLLECNPLKIDCKNKLEWSVLHTFHKRGLYCIATDAPRVQSMDQSSDQLQDEWKVWTVAQDRNMVCYSFEKKQKLATYNTCGSFIYTLQSCPYDAKKIAVSVGDGAVRVWESDICDEDGLKLSLGNVMSFWQNVQGKVLTSTWHPTKENLLAFATAESRIGIIDASKSERPAKNLLPGVNGAIYSLCWGDKFDLYACGGGDMVLYHTDQPEQAPEPINVEFEGKKLQISSGVWYPMGLVCGSYYGAVAVLNPVTYELVTATFVFSKMIHNITWHPQQTSNSSEESPNKNLIAVSSLDKECFIAILEYADKGDGPKLHPWKMLNGHLEPVCQVTWNPHKDGYLLSTSYDSTVRVWDVSDGKCIAIFDGHYKSSFSSCWSAFPQLSSTIMSGGADCCLRIWKYEDHPPEAYSEVKHETALKEKKRERKERKEEKKSTENAAEEKPTEIELTEGQVATNVDINAKIKAPKRFLLPTIQRQMSPCTTIQSVRKLAEKYILVSDKVQSNGKLESPDQCEEKNDSNDVKEDKLEDVDFTKMFGSTNDINDLLDMEMRKHIENDRFEASIMLSIFRGHIDSMIQFATQRDALCPFLVSLSPCVSFKYWKTVTQLYLAQIERLVAKSEHKKLWENKHYGGQIYRKVALLLSIHDVKGAVTALTDAKLYKEAYILSKSRHMDSIAEETLKMWTADCAYSGYINMTAICYLGLGDVYNAAVTLAKSNDQECLSLAAELAKVAGQPTFANHIEDKRSQIQSETPEKETEDLKPLPSKLDLLLKNIQITSENVTETNEE
ncbi:gem-associated protein 5-like [Vanessa atalanta]|uniref:gem-associated protein 5-like n=1 Tax=Vanessa atalanta TaxID=42275 RepID=UPI001FCDAEAE|nr:gem-associated protein 5-like [Vanessa atalanta]